MRENRTKDVALLGLKLGITAFGGPAAHIAMLRQDVVEKRRWLSEQHFLDLLGITNLIPGPNSTEMVMHVGHERAGAKGLVAVGAAFILPAAAITLLFAWLYVEFGSTTQGAWILIGIKPVVLAVVAQAIWNLGRAALKTVTLAMLGVLVLTLYLLGINELLLLFGAGFLMLAIDASRQHVSFRAHSIVAPWLIFPALIERQEIAYSTLRLFLTFLKIGSVLYGSGYVLLAFIEGDFFDRLGWLTRQQLLDAVAVGQFTPGPVFTTATFVGYVIGGFKGAVVATIGIFLPAFCFVAIAQRYWATLMAQQWTRPLLNGVNVAAIGLMAAVGVSLAFDAIVSPLTACLFLVALVLLLRFHVNSAVLILAGAMVSVFVNYFG